MMTAKFTTTTLRAANHYLPDQALMNNVCPLSLTAYFLFTRGSNNAYILEYPCVDHMPMDVKFNLHNGIMFIVHLQHSVFFPH